jgi:hypothetical protein
LAIRVVPRGLRDVELRTGVGIVVGATKGRQSRGLANVGRKADVDTKAQAQGYAGVGRRWLVGACERRVRRGTRGHIVARHPREPSSLSG